MLDLSEQLTSDLNPAAVCNAWSETLTFEAPVTVDESDTELEVCVFFTAGPIIKLYAGVGPVRNPVL